MNGIQIQVQQDIHCCTWWRRPRQLRAHTHIYAEATRAHATPFQEYRKTERWMHGYPSTPAVQYQNALENVMNYAKGLK
jgi:hypothetical protein